MGRLRSGWKALDASIAAVRRTPATIWLSLAVISLTAPIQVLDIWMGAGLEESGSLGAIGSLSVGNPTGVASSDLPGSIGAGAGFYSSLVHFTVGAAVVGLVALALRDEAADVGEAFGMVRANLPVLTAWAFVQALVAAGLTIGVAAEPGGLALVGLLAVAGLWALATFFVLPAILLDGAGPLDAFRRSVARVREVWLATIVTLTLLAIAFALVVWAILGLLLPILIEVFQPTPNGEGLLGALVTLLAVLALPGAVYSAIHAGLQAHLYGTEVEDGEPPKAPTR